MPSLTTRATHRRPGWRPWLAVAAVLAGALALAVLWVLQDAPRRRHYEVPAAPGGLSEARLPSDAASLARGRHLAQAVALCTVCHGEQLGGQLAFDHPLLGRGHTPNLTRGRGGIGAAYTVADWERALRHGVDRQGRGLLFMPVDHYRQMRPDDLAALIAYLRQLPPVDNTDTTLALSPLARLMIDLGLSGPVVRAALIDHRAPPPAPPVSEGAYLVAVGGCTFCHGPALRGGQGLEPGAPPGPPLVPGSAVARAGIGALAAALRQGRSTNGQPIDPKFMPWPGYARLSEAELQAIWQHLQQQSPL